VAEPLMTAELRGEIVAEYGSLEAGMSEIDTAEHNPLWTDSYAVLPDETPYIDRIAWVYRGIKQERERATHTPADDAAPLPVPVRPPLPNETQLNSYNHASLEKAVKSFHHDHTRGDVERGAKLPPQDARRVRLMFGINLFRLNADEKLVVDPRVARKGSKYVLRYLDESGTRWLDPNVELRGW
jgi:hypothetical protein